MEVERFVLGMYGTNTYMLSIDNDVILVDPASKAEKLFPVLEGKKLLAVLLTHGHFDHIKAVDGLYEKYKMPIYVHSEDERLIRDKSQRALFGLPYSPTISSPVEHLKEGSMEIGPFKFDVIFTPGHSKGSVCYAFDEYLIAGDTLFKNSVGRTDLPGGDESELRASLRVLKELNPCLKVLPGHDDVSVLEDEINNNPFMR